jgi:NAD(P)H-hydrate epimerase
MLGGSVKGKPIACLAGRGNNGGDGFVASRHLRDWGANVTVILSGGRENLTGVPARQLLPLERAGLPILAADAPLSGYSLLIDALLGYSSVGDPREPMAGLIRRANASGVRILALDLPSGLDPTTGEPGNPCVEAATTVTLGLPKVGFLNPHARRYLGHLLVADISIPPEIYSKRSQPAGLFESDRIVSIW